MNEYLRAFVIGSCFFVFFPYFIIVYYFLGKSISYAPYTFIAPIALGLFNVLSLILSKQFHLTKTQQFLSISLIAPTLVALFVYTFKIYGFNTISGWTQYLITLYAIYFFVFNVVVYLLDKHI